MASKEADHDQATVKVSLQRFRPDPDGPIVGTDGTRGFYDEPEEQVVKNLVTTNGIDFLHAQMYSIAPAANGANYIGVSQDTVAPSAADTTLTGEITTGGLDRQQAGVSHNTASSISIIQKTFASTSQFLAVQKIGLFSAVSGGTLVREITITPVDVNLNDLLNVTWIITFPA